MTEPALNFRAELRPTPKLVLAAIAGLGLLLTLSAESLPPEVSGRALMAALALYALPIVGWLLTDWHHLAGRWFTTLMVIALVDAASIWFGVPQFLAWSVLGVVLAALLISLAAAVLTALLQSLVLIGLGLIPISVKMDPLTIWVTVVSLWLMAALMVAVYLPVNQRLSWVEAFFLQARSFHDEAQARRAELEQVVANLAHANRQLALAEERSAALRQIAEEAEKAKAMFVANVSHELRTPLNMIMGLIELMVGSPEIYTMALPPKMRADLEVIQRNCEHLSNMINDVLDLTRIEAGRMALHRERVELRAIVRHAGDVVRPLLEKKRLTLECHLPEDLPEVYCDRVRVQQVVLNLLSNAARLTETGGITVTASQQGPDVLVSVADTGPGIPPEEIGHIFEPFSQGATQLWRARGGSGLGLSISKRFIDLHGGRMWVESVYGAGTTFFFTLPISAPIRPASQPGGWIREGWSRREHDWLGKPILDGQALARPRVVVYDDTGNLWPELSRYAGEIELVSAAAPMDAETLRQCPAHAVLVNTADAATVRDAVETLSQAVTDAPIIGCCAPEAAPQIQKAGAHGQLIKPIKRADLMRILQAAGSPVRRVLVADDNPESLELVKRMLLACDSRLEVVAVGSGTAVLDALETMPPDLLLLEGAMADLDGWQILAQRRERQLAPHTRVYLMSSQDLAETPKPIPFLVVAFNGGIAQHRLLPVALALSTALLKPLARDAVAPV